MNERNSPLAAAIASIGAASTPTDGYVAPPRPERPPLNLATGIAFLYDTETTGLPDFHAPSEGAQQPHIAQFAGALVDLETRAVLERFEAYGRPDGWTIPPEVAAIHGITTEHALEHGIPEAEIVARAVAMNERCTVRVAHMVTFDDRIMRIGLKRFADDETADTFRDGRAVYCTCKATTNLCQLPFANGRRGRGGAFKYPKLSEAYRHFFGEEMTGAHTADGDLNALIAVFFAIRDDAAARAKALA
jgi:DNA polymerase-3 subunit epsilon